MPQNPQKKISKTSHKNYNQFRNVRIEALRWVQMTTYTGIKFKVETSAKERYQKLLDFITIDILKLEQQPPSSQYIITLSMNPIINSSLNKHPMQWEIIHRRLLRPFESAMKEMCLHQTLYVIPRHYPKKIHKSPRTIHHTEKRQLSTREQQFKPVTFNQENLFTWTLNFTISLLSVVLSPCSQ